MSMNSYKGISPTRDHVLIEVLDNDVQRKSGLYVPSYLTETYKYSGIVRAVGPGRYSKKGVRIPMPPLYGETVLLDDFNPGHKFKLDGERFLLTPERSIVAVL